MILKQRKLLEVKGDRVRFQFLSVLGPIRVHILRSRNIYSLVQGPLKQMDGIALIFLADLICPNECAENLF